MIAGPGRELPSGTVTFLLTDIEGSTRHWETSPGAMRTALLRHDAILNEGIAEHSGHVLTERGRGRQLLRRLRAGQRRGCGRVGDPAFPAPGAVA